MTRRPPFIFRLMLTSLFLPIFIATAVLWWGVYTFGGDGFWETPEQLRGLPVLWFVLSLMGLPFLLGLWIFWSGNWRRPVLAAGIVYVSAFLLVASGFIETNTPPESRTVDWSNGPWGADVYCNGVRLGTLPLKIQVDRLKAEVPEWNVPPEQRWYEPGDLSIYTWFPWDDFQKERYASSQELFAPGKARTVSNLPRAMNARLTAMAEHDADCRYWWSFKKNDVQFCFARSGNPYYLNTPFEKIGDRYYVGSYYTSFSPSASFHVRLLADVLPDLSPEEKDAWDRHVLEHWPLVGENLASTLEQEMLRLKKQGNDSTAKLYYKALEPVVRLKYKLSDPPTEEECRRLLNDWVERSVDGRLFVFYNSHDSGDLTGSPSMPAIVDAGERSLIHLALRLMGEKLHPLLVRQWKENRYRDDNARAVSAFLSMADPSPEYFVDFARYSATSRNGRGVLLDNEDPRTEALFETLLYRRPLADSLTRREFLYARSIENFMGIDNRRTEAAFRKYVVDALSDPELRDNTRDLVNRAVFNAVYARIHRENVDKDELASWVASLPLKPATKSLALRMLRIRRTDSKSFADLMQQAVGQKALIETELTLEDVLRWFSEHPEANLYEFFSAHEDSIVVSDVFDPQKSGFRSYSTIDVLKGDIVEYAVWNDLPECFVVALLKSDTAEGDPEIRSLIKRLWNSNAGDLETAIGNVYGVRYDLFLRHDVQTTVTLPDYLLDLIATERTEPGRSAFPLIQSLAFCDSPKAEAILQSRYEKAAKAQKQELERALNIWQTRSVLRQRKMELFRELVAEKISPDDLLVRQAPWIWKEGKYVRAGESPAEEP